MSTEMLEYLRGTKLGEGGLLCTPNPTHPAPKVASVPSLRYWKESEVAVGCSLHLSTGGRMESFPLLGDFGAEENSNCFWSRNLMVGACNRLNPPSDFPALSVPFPPTPFFFLTTHHGLKWKELSYKLSCSGSPPPLQASRCPCSKGEPSRSPLPPPPNSKEREGERKSSGVQQSATLVFDFTHTPFPAPLPPPTPPNRGVGCRERRERGILSRGRPGGLGCGPRPRAAGSLRPKFPRVRGTGRRCRVFAALVPGSQPELSPFHGSIGRPAGVEDPTGGNGLGVPVPRPWAGMAGLWLSGGRVVGPPGTRGRIECGNPLPSRLLSYLGRTRSGVFLGAREIMASPFPLFKLLKRTSLGRFSLRSETFEHSFPGPGDAEEGEGKKVCWRRGGSDLAGPVFWGGRYLIGTDFQIQLLNLEQLEKLERGRGFGFSPGGGYLPFSLISPWSLAILYACPRVVLYICVWNGI
ncbi:Formin-2, partial [Ophiophagus hannah]